MKNIIREGKRTLLGSFVHERTRRYLEPSREGTPRGKTIGFSGVKYGATLYGLTNIKQKEIAEHLEVSHGLLRKWNTEEPFKAMVDKHCREFAEVFIRNMRDRIKQRETQNDVYLGKSLQEIASQDIPSLNYEEISDARSYSNKVYSYITLALIAVVDKSISENDVTLSLEIYCMIDALKFFREGKKSERSENDIKISNRLSKSLEKEGIEILLKPDLSEEDRKSLLSIIKVLALNIKPQF